MKIISGTSAKLVYSLYIASNNKLIERIEPDKPVVFTFGTGQLIAGFEKNLSGLQQGDGFDFILKADEAYGPVDSYAIFDIPKNTFEVEGKIDDEMLKIGNIFPMQDNDGIRHEGKIINIHAETLTMDFNHPLAGKDLHFVGEIIEVLPTQNN